MPQVIEVFISPQGEIRIQTKGYSGSSCQDASRALEQALGVTRNEQKTAEFYAAAETQQHLQQ